MAVPAQSSKNQQGTPEGPWRRGWRVLRRHRPGMVGLGIVSVFILLALLAPWLSPLDPFAQNTEFKFLPPWGFDGHQWPYLLGTDLLGRDLLSRIITGSRISLLIGVISVAVGAGVGVPMGMVSAYCGGVADLVIMRFIDIMLAFPPVLLAVVIVSILGPSLVNAMIAIGLVAAPTYARIVRASVLSEKEREYVLAAKSLGFTHIPILFKVILPNILGPLLVIVSLSFASAVLEGAALSFIGLGAEPPMPEWGALLFEGKQSLYQAPWLIWFPGLAIVGIVVGFNLLGDGFRDAFDPKSIRR